MNILILGATGFIGSAVARRLAADGHAVTGLGRDIRRAQTQFAHMKWLKADLNNLVQPDDWIQLLRGQDIVVNCAGALQDGLHDNLAASQQQAMIALYAAASKAGTHLIVQISASTDGAASGTAFLETKRHADEALAASGLPYVIFRPAVVVGRNAFGGTALLRALAAIPCVTPLVYADSPVTIVSLDDVAESVAKAVSGDIQANSDLHLAAPQSETVESLVRLHRSWLGLPQARVVRIPAFLARLVGWIADRLGTLGWRSPLRSTAMTVIAGGMATERKTILPHGHEFKSAQETLSAHPAGIQDLWFARLYFAKPLVFAMLALFWLASGLIPLLDPGRASAFMEPFMSSGLAVMLTLLTCALDIGLGLAIVFRPWSRAALLGMLALSAAYLAAGTVLTPALWIDPLGPFVKVLPSMLLAVIGLAILEER
jgi:uncharacterized protein YbjT (DUF2867 family)